ncbi:MAG: bifunctional nuclease family protein [Acidimicrobiales bacterium]
MTTTGPQDTDGAGPEPGLDPGTWRLAVVAGVRMELPGEYPEVLVHEAVAPWRELAIPVGLADGNAIAYGWRKATTPRPLTHALFTDVLERHGITVAAVRVTARRGRSFFAELDTTGPRGRQIIPCRPSDAFALVLRQRLPTPVLVAEWVFDPEGTGDPVETAGPDESADPVETADPVPTGQVGESETVTPTDDVAPGAETSA